ncbi:triose-phosphate isomerase [Stakelama tenebrarum]|uniref:Triosephosphate isomerase n=1 Tax=Stakelama tenebrarum TaxID=2711215 RepID=A0A6G6Y6S8_9SPHN|nr:triose-phosphate isomerase [Sphingosinithalassobacter tenebrarum]QIG80418.1 triose-phosphate isomerase [Sphingosinithalassobacter tenebrarum]
MRRKFIAGNWKMNGLKAQLGEVESIAGAASDNSGVDVALCVPFTLIAPAVAAAGSMPVGAQDVHAAQSGAHTGCISAAMLTETGAGLVIVGHSERRADQCESSGDAWAKALAARGAGLHVILCCGETEEERDAGQTEAVVAEQIAAIPGDAHGDWLTIAYEPRWAIGTGKTPTEDEIAATHGAIRAKLGELAGKEAADTIRILYGGSMNPANAAAILALSDVDGGLIGGASLTAEKFVPIIEAAAKA